MSKRKGRFVLAEDGTLEGDVRLEYTGHEAAARKTAIEGDTPEQRADNFREMVKSRAWVRWKLPISGWTTLPTLKNPSSMNAM